MKQSSRSSKRKGAYRKGHKASHHETEEFGPGKVDVLVCPSCSAVYYYKSWHHNMLRYRALDTKKQVRFKVCPACAMWKNKQWEGELKIAGAPSEFEEQIQNTILKVADEAYRRDPLHRLFDIKKTKKEWTVYTSENQLAHRIAKKLFSSIKKHFSKPDIHYGKGEDAVLITMEWLET